MMSTSVNGGLIMKQKGKLTDTERKLIGEWHGKGISNKECARRLSREPSTIGRELKRNCFHTEIGQTIYEPLHAQGLADERKERAWGAKLPLKNEQIFKYVMRHLRKGWSPEQISGRLRKQDHPGEKDWSIDPETIYQYIYAKKSRSKRLWELLRRGQKRRRKKNGRKAQRVRIPDRVSIHDRPQEVAERKVFGHWEGDSIVGKGHQSGLHTSYERVSSLTRIWPMARVDSESSIQAQKRIFEVYPQGARKTTTLDNGKEHVRHTELKIELGIQSYFADAYKSCQRGGNENANLWIRYYFPKGTDFSTLTLQDIQDVEWELNNRPRRRLNYKTPDEVFSFHLKGLQS